MSNKIEIYIDGLSSKLIKKNVSKKIKGYTYNPSLFAAAGVKNYLLTCKNISKAVYPRPVSLEVIADDYKNMITQATKLSKLNKNIYVKIPITYTNGKYTTDVIDQLIRSKIKLNITAVFNLMQVKRILPFIKNTRSIISVFVGRIYDSGFDAATEVRKIVKYTKKNSKCRILWASTRQVYDIKLAEKENCDIITVDYSIFKKIKLFNKHWKKFSLETVRQFYSDAIKSNFKI